MNSNIALSLFLTACMFAMPTVCADTSPDDLLGQWFTEDDDSKVLVSKKNGKYYGKIIWLKDPLYEKGDKDAGKPKRDRENPNKKLRKTPIIDLQVLEGFMFVSKEKSWEQGTIYDPEKGKTYKCVMKFESDSKVEGGRKLYVRGYIGIPTLGRTTYWTRVPEEKLEVIVK